MSPKQRMLFMIEHMNTPFKKEILLDFEASLAEAKYDELMATGTIDGGIVHYNDDGSTICTQEIRKRRLEDMI